MAYAVSDWKGPFQMSVFNQLDSYHETGLSDVTHVGKCDELLEPLLQIPNLGLQSFERPFLAEDPEICQGGSASQRISRVSMTVKEGLELCVFAMKHAEDFFCGERGSQRKSPTGESLCERKKIR